jgi:DNA replication protein DnaC
LPKLYFNGDDLRTVLVKDKYYVNDEYYKKHYQVYKDLGIEHKYSPLNNTAKKTFTDAFNHMYKDINIDSHAPYFESSKLFSYRAEEIEKGTGIDMNNCYPSVLSKLPYLLVHSSYKDKYYKYVDGMEIIDNYIYNVECITPNILIPSSGQYTGFILKQSDNYIIHEVFECRKVNNYYTEFIEKMKNKYDKKYFKTGLNHMIGGMSSYRERCEFLRPTKICNKQEAKATKCHNYKRIKGSDYFACMDIDKVSMNVINRIPIHIYMMDMMRIEIVKKINELGKKEEDILQIRCDNIYFKGDDIEAGKGWKLEQPSIYTSVPEWEDEYQDRIPENIQYDRNVKINRHANTLFYGFAGCGKTYSIMKYLENYDGKYVVVTPTHEALLEYRKAGINCNILTCHLNSKKFEKHLVIVDEIGMCGQGKMLKLFELKEIYKCKIHAWGDFNQLPPVGGKKINENPYMLRKIFDKFMFVGTNYRNKLPLDFYRKIINGELTQKQKFDIINIINKKSKNTNLIVGYYNKTRKECNDLLSKKFKKDLYTKNCKVICKTNDLRKYDLYNNFKLLFVKMEEDMVILKDSYEKYKIPKSLYDKHFQLNYSSTLYGVQGRTIDFGSMGIADVEKLSDNTDFYTMISRFRNITLEDIGVKSLN